MKTKEEIEIFIRNSDFFNSFEYDHREYPTENSLFFEEILRFCEINFSSHQSSGRSIYIEISNFKVRFSDHVALYRCGTSFDPDMSLSFEEFVFYVLEEVGYFDEDEDEE